MKRKEFIALWMAKREAFIRDEVKAGGTGHERCVAVQAALAPPKRATAIVYMHGGLVDRVIADVPILYVICDSDTEGAEADDLTAIPAGSKLSGEFYGETEIHTPRVRLSSVSKDAIKEIKALI